VQHAVPAALPPQRLGETRGPQAHRRPSAPPPSTRPRGVRLGFGGRDDDSAPGSGGGRPHWFQEARQLGGPPCALRALLVDGLLAALVRAHVLLPRVRACAAAANLAQAGSCAPAAALHRGLDGQTCLLAALALLVRRRARRRRGRARGAEGGLGLIGFGCACCSASIADGRAQCRRCCRRGSPAG